MLLVLVLAILADTAQSPPPDAAENANSENANQNDNAADTESLVETWVQYAMPGEHHKLLERMAGEWKTHIEYRMTADSPVVESEGTCRRKWILGKRFLLEEFDGGNLGLPFQGLAIYGYDEFEKKYASVWVDTMNTAMTTSKGTCEPPCDLISFVGTHGDPWTGKKRSSRGVTRFIDETSHALELHESGADGREFKMLEIIYTRTKSSG
jgi:hypothetical protein